MITEQNKATWLQWIDEQLDHTQDKTKKKLKGTNRVFLTDQDDRDIAIHLLKELRDTLTNTTLQPNKYQIVEIDIHHPETIKKRGTPPHSKRPTRKVRRS